MISVLGVSKQLEVFLVITIGISVLLFDSSLFQMRSDLDEVWTYNFDPKLPNENVETFLKYILSGVIFIRTFTLHIFLALYIVMLWPVIFGEKSNLMIPWLLVGLVRILAVNLVALVTGSYICFIQKGQHSICLDFLLAQIIQHGPSVYAWFSILSYYQDLQLNGKHKHTRISLDHELASRRKKARCMEGANLSEESVKGSMNFSCESSLGSSYYELISTSSLIPSSSRSLDTLLKSRSNELFHNIQCIQEDENNGIDEIEKELIDEIDEAAPKNARKDVSFKDIPEVTVAGSLNVPDSRKTVCKACSRKDETTITELKQQAIACGYKNKKDNHLKNCATQISVLNKNEQLCITQQKSVNKSVKSTNLKSTVVLKETKQKRLILEKDFLEDTKEVVESFIQFMLKLHRRINFGCQVNTLNKSLLNQPAEEGK